MTTTLLDAAKAGDLKKAKAIVNQFDSASGINLIKGRREYLAKKDGATGNTELFYILQQATKNTKTDSEEWYEILKKYIEIMSPNQDRSPDPELLKHLFDIDKTALSFAVSTGNYDIVQKLLKFGFPPFTKDFSGLSPLQIAAKFSSDNSNAEDIMRDLIFNGRSSKEILKREAGLALITALEKHDMVYIKLLIEEADANVLSTSETSKTPALALMSKILKDKSNDAKNEKDNQEKTIIKSLYKKQIDDAIKAKNHDFFKQAFQHNALDINEYGDKEKLYTFFASQGWTDELKELEKQDPENFKAVAEKLELIKIACVGNDLRLLQFLIQKRVDINQTYPFNGNKASPLMMAILASNEDIFLELLKSNPRDQIYEKWTLPSGEIVQMSALDYTLICKNAATKNGNTRWADEMERRANALIAKSFRPLNFGKDYSKYNVFQIIKLIENAEFIFKKDENEQEILQNTIQRYIEALREKDSSVIYHWNDGEPRLNYKTLKSFFDRVDKNFYKENPMVGREFLKEFIGTSLRKVQTSKDQEEREAIRAQLKEVLKKHPDFLNEIYRGARLSISKYRHEYDRIERESRNLYDASILNVYINSILDPDQVARKSPVEINEDMKMIAELISKSAKLSYERSTRYEDYKGNSIRLLTDKRSELNKKPVKSDAEIKTLERIQHLQKFLVDRNLDMKTSRLYAAPAAFFQAAGFTSSIMNSYDNITRAIPLGILVPLNILAFIIFIPPLFAISFTYRLIRNFIVGDCYKPSIESARTSEDGSDNGVLRLAAAVEFDKQDKINQIEKAEKAEKDLRDISGQKEIKEIPETRSMLIAKEQALNEAIAKETAHQAGIRQFIAKKLNKTESELEIIEQSTDKGIVEAYAKLKKVAEQALNVRSVMSRELPDKTKPSQEAEKPNQPTFTGGSAGSPAIKTAFDEHVKAKSNAQKSSADQDKISEVDQTKKPSK